MYFEEKKLNVDRLMKNAGSEIIRMLLTPQMIMIHRLLDDQVIYDKLNIDQVLVENMPNY